MKEESEKILNYLLERRSKDRSINFKIRSRAFHNKRNGIYRGISNGYFFRGADWYLQLTFWNGSDGVKMTYTLGFTYLKLESVQSCYLELSFHEHKEYKNVMHKIISLFPNENVNKIDEWKYYCYMSSSSDYLANLNIFINDYKPKIDSIIIDSEASLISPVSSKVCEAGLTRIAEYREIDDNKLQRELEKSLEPSSVSDLIMMGSEEDRSADDVKHKHSPNEQTRPALHAKAQKIIHEWCKNYLKLQHVKYERNRIDVSGFNNANELYMFEIKTYDNDILAIRNAIGQLIEYNLNLDEYELNKIMIIASTSRLTEQGEIILSYLDENHKLNFGYIFIDIEQETAYVIRQNW